MKIEIVSHVWNYARLWTYQMSSLLLHPPAADVQMTVCFCLEDKATYERIADFCRWGAKASFTASRASGPSRVLAPFACPGWPRTVSIQPWYFERTHLMRRAIGRNWAAKSTTADLVWFADADMVFGPGALDDIAGQIANWHDRPEVLFYPRKVWRTEQPDGDRLVDAATNFTGPLEMPLDNLHHHPYPAAIGGVQIVLGDVARAAGYLPDYSRFQQPEARWMQTKEDPAYRRALSRLYGHQNWRGHPLDIANVFRIRHSERGREKEGLVL